MSKPFVLAIFVAAVSAFLYAKWDVVLPDAELTPTEVAVLHPSLDLLEIQQIGPNSIFDAQTNNYKFGRYTIHSESATDQLRDVHLHPLTAGQMLMQRKQWHFSSVSDGRYLVGLVVANFGYLGSGFMYVFDQTTGYVDKQDSIMPLGIGATMAAGPLEGCSTWNVPISKTNISQCFDRAENSWKIDASTTMESGRFVSLRASIPLSGQSLGMVFPMGSRRASFTNKLAGLQADASLRVGVNCVPDDKACTDGDIKMDNPLALIDWTRSMHRRMTVWFWSALSFVTSNRHSIGIQLSTGVYQTPDGQDLENAVWIDGDMHILPTLQWGNTGDAPGQDKVQVDKLFAISGSGVDLKFVMVGSVPSSVNIGLFHGELLHTFGTYTGSVTIDGTKHELPRKGVPGIFEDHWAKW